MLFRESLKNIKHHPVKYITMSIRKFPRFWVTSHSCVFGIDKPNSWYIQERRYFPFFLKSCLLFIHTFFLILSIIGIFLVRQQWNSFMIPLLVVCYFTGHIFLVSTPRYHIPVLPYIFIFASVCLITMNKKLLGRKSE